MNLADLRGVGYAADTRPRPCASAGDSACWRRASCSASRLTGRLKRSIDLMTPKWGQVDLQTGQSADAATLARTFNYPRGNSKP